MNAPACLRRRQPQQQQRLSAESLQPHPRASALRAAPRSPRGPRPLPLLEGAHRSPPLRAQHRAVGRWIGDCPKTNRGDERVVICHMTRESTATRERQVALMGRSTTRAWRTGRKAQQLCCAHQATRCESGAIKNTDPTAPSSFLQPSWAPSRRRCCCRSFCGCGIFTPADSGVSPPPSAAAVESRGQRSLLSSDRENHHLSVRKSRR